MSTERKPEIEPRCFLIRPLLIGLFLVVMAVVGAVAWTASRTRTRPDPRLSVPLGHWPNQADIDRLVSVKGRTPTETIRILGHPSKVDLTDDGAEFWDFPWMAACRVWFKNGVVDDVYYTAGY